MLNHAFGMEPLDPSVPPPKSKQNQQQPTKRMHKRPPIGAQQIYDEQRDEWLKSLAYFVALK
jgi:hypothetical protein